MSLAQNHRIDYKNTTRVGLSEVDFSFYENNHKVKEMTEVTSYDHEACIIASYYPPRFMSRKIIRGQRKRGRAWETLGSHFLGLMCIFMERKIHFR